MKTFKVSYSYKNSVCPSLSLWMVIPSGAKATRAQPEQVTLLPTGEELGYFVLEEGTELEVTFEQENTRRIDRCSLMRSACFTSGIRRFLL